MQAASINKSLSEHQISMIQLNLSEKTDEWKYSGVNSMQDDIPEITGHPPKYV